MISQLKFNGIGEYTEYKAFKFPDGSLKVMLQPSWVSTRVTPNIKISISFKNNDDVLLLGLLCDVLKSKFSGIKITCEIRYMMYQQDDRRFAESESFGLKFICNILNSYQIDRFEVFHPHSDKVEFLRNCTIINNNQFIKSVLNKIPNYSIWIIPDSGAAKNQLKQLDILAPNMDFEIASKTRDHSTGGLKQFVGRANFETRPCIIFDDICLKGGTFLGLYDLLKERNAGDIYLAVSHGIFNEGIEHLTSKIKHIFTTNSITTLQPNENLSIFNLNYPPTTINIAESLWL